MAAIGIAVKRWVSFHGFALNINNPLTLAQGIMPCGFVPEWVTSLKQEAQTDLNLEEVKKVICTDFKQWWRSEYA